LWGLSAWFIAGNNFSREYQSLIDKEQQHAQDISLDIADSFRRNLHFVAGVSDTFRQGLRIWKAVAKFGPGPSISHLPKETLVRRWTSDPVLQDLNNQLNLIQRSLSIDSIFVVNAAGDCISASDWSLPGTPIGSNYADRQWYSDALNGKRGMQYAMGRTSHVPGLFFSAPVLIDNKFSGAIISKINLPSLSFLTRNSEAYVADSNGVIIIARDPAMLMMSVPGATVDTLSTQEKMALYEKTEFPQFRITPWNGLPGNRVNHTGNGDAPYVTATAELPEYGLRIFSKVELPSLPMLERQQLSTFLLLWVVGSVAILIAGGILFYLRSVRHAKAAAETSEKRMQLLLSSVSNGIWGLDKLGNTVFVNKAAAKMVGYIPEELIQIPMHSTVHHSYADGTHYPTELCPMHATLVDGKPRIGADEVLWRKDGSSFPVDYSSYPIFQHGALDGAVVVFEDITERKQKDEALTLASSVYQSSNDGIVVSDENNLILDVNPAFTKITGYTLEEVRGRNPRMFQSGKHDREFFEQMWQSILETGHWQGEVWDKLKNGELQAKWLSISVIRHADGSVFRYVGQFSDITEKKRKDELIWEQANFDALTNLPNRRLFADRFRQAMSSSSRSWRYGALLSLDLDQFKRLNDTFGHSKGDLLLIEVARRLRLCVREEDTVARMGGDEFMIVLTALSPNKNEAGIQAELISEKIRSELCRPYQLDNSEHYTSCSVGIVLFLGHADSHEKLLAHVDTAMYQAKAKGRNSICFFDASMQDVLDQRGLLESSLRLALELDEISLHYQLQVDSSGHAIGVEALLRWTNPQLGVVPPMHFIPVAEESGLILPIGMWVLETACKQLSAWQSSPQFSHLSIAVNVSAIQFREPGFVAIIQDVLRRSGINSEKLKLELTESLVIDNIDDSVRKMKEIKALGVKFSMDDFGTGYSSLSYLSRLPFDQLKIDQSFVRTITTDQHNAAIVQTIISMAQSLGMDVIAEGVETEDQREFLDLRGCPAYQGYLYAKPTPIAELEALVVSLNSA
jgi:diguanylate cyclase (GGDEF)-like protein/PAS domain S-box-containing protein